MPGLRRLKIKASEFSVRLVSKQPGLTIKDAKSGGRGELPRPLLASVWFKALDFSRRADKKINSLFGLLVKT